MVLGNIAWNIDAKVKCQIMYVLINSSPPKLLGIATSNLQVHVSHNVEDTGQYVV